MDGPFWLGVTWLKHLGISPVLNRDCLLGFVPLPVSLGQQ